MKKSIYFLLVLLANLLGQTETAAQANTFIVTNTANSGSGSLRQAVLNANANPDPDLITFAITTAPPFSIAVNSPIFINGDLTIDGSTQSGWAGSPIIQVGENLVNQLVFDVQGGTVVFKYLDVSKTGAQSGSGISAVAVGCTIENCWIKNRNEGIIVSQPGANLVTITGNDLTNSFKGIHLINLDGGVITATNNTFGGTLNNAIWLQGVSNLTIGATSGNIQVGTQLKDSDSPIIVDGGSNISVTDLDLRKPGARGAYGLQFYQTTGITVTNCMFENRIHGLTVNNSSNFDISCNLFQNQGQGVEFNNLGAGTQNFVNNHFSCNTTAVVQLGTEAVTAQSNHWDSPNPPTQNGFNGYSGNVDVSNHLAAPPGCTAAPNQAIFYLDADADHYSNGTSVLANCAPPGYVDFLTLISTTGDCNDANSQINPGADELCDNLDNDCDGATDENLISAFFPTVIPDCLNGTINKITVSGVVGGTLPFIYSIDGGLNNQPSNLFSNLSSGTYNVVVADNFGCSLTQTVVVDPLMTLTTSATNVSCYGGTNGSASVVVSSGTAPIAYVWQRTSPTPIVQVGTTASILGLSKGTYKVTVTNGNGCQTIGTVQVNQPPNLQVNVTVQTNVSCFGGSNGSLTANAIGGTSPYSYSWGSFGNGTPITGLPVGIYTCTATDNNGCTATRSRAITGPSVPLSILFKQKNVSCFGGSNGTIQTKVTGGTKPLAYLWSNFATTQNISNLAAGPYSVTVTDFNGCTKTASTTIIQPAADLQLNVTFNLVSPGLWNAILTSTGGTAPHKYCKVIPVNACNFTLPSSSIFKNLPSSTSFEFRVKDKNLCEKSFFATSPAFGDDPTDRSVENENRVLKIFPNPNAGNFSIELPFAAKADMVLKIFDPAGKLILEKTANPESPSQTIEASHLPEGLYFLQVVLEGKVLAVEKFVKQ